MEYRKCPFKKRPIFVIKEEDTLVEEDCPLDLSIKKPLQCIRRNILQFQKAMEIPINFSNRLDTIKEEDCQTIIYEEKQNCLNVPQDLSSKNYIQFVNCNNSQVSSSYLENQFEITTFNSNRNYNNNLIDSTRIKDELNYIKNLRTSPISPNDFSYIDKQYENIKYSDIIEDDFNTPQDLTIKSQIKSTILVARNPNIMEESNIILHNQNSLNRHNDDSYYRCSTCTKCYSTYKGLIKHQQTHITNNEQNYINVIENTSNINTIVTTTNNDGGFNNNSNINNNNQITNLQQRVVNIHRYQCKDCGKSYSTCSGLTKHQQFHCPNAEGNQVKKVFSCKNCDKVYVSLGALKMHIRTHTLPCKCPQCGKAFSRPWLLQGHIRTHTGEKPFSCQHCNRAFADRSNLRAHLQTHSDIKKYSCTTCSKTFSRMSLLGKHLQSGCPGTIKINQLSETIINQTASQSYDNHNDFVVKIEQLHQNETQTNSGNIHYFNSVIKGPTNYEQQNHQQSFEKILLKEDKEKDIIETISYRKLTELPGNGCCCYGIEPHKGNTCIIFAMISEKVTFRSFYSEHEIVPENFIEMPSKHNIIVVIYGKELNNVLIMKMDDDNSVECNDDDPLLYLK
ncbi:zinc finger protein 287-like, partial [Condylostylus longicornis]|uniref:zinc finger protein 287-like n=1 Tax=Condylostylus longicornis TaxID=2530218 RepID=UPI00244DC084